MTSATAGPAEMDSFREKQEASSVSSCCHHLPFSMSESRHDRQQIMALPLFESHPPTWLPPISGEGDLGYPGFHPVVPGQDEDRMSPANVKSGYVLPQPVEVESFSAQAMINEKLKQEGTLLKLEELMNEVFARREGQLPPVPPSSFRMPPRVTLNDAKRQAWFADLANPEVPLYKLGKSVPHGAKGHDLLDQLHDNNVAVERAVWLLRVFGANETAGLRNKPSYNPTQYSVEWANIVTSYLRKQLDFIVLPTAPRPGLTYKHTFKGVLSDAESRERWVSRFSYTLKLLRTFYHEGLVDSKTFLSWLVQQMKGCNLAQGGFITRIVNEYLDDIVKSLALAKPLIEASLNKLSEISANSANDTLVDTDALLRANLHNVFAALPDAFISPRLWTQYEALIESAISESQLSQSSTQGQSWTCSRERIPQRLVDIRRRNDSLAFREPPAKVSAKLSTAVSNVKLLNSISSDTDLSSFTLFDQDSRDPMSFPEKLDMLLTWSVTPLQYGDHRPLAAVTLIQNWREKASERATRRGQSDPNALLQDQLFDWLDRSDVAGEKTNIRSIALLYGKLVKLDLFSFPGYIQRLIARGESGLANEEGQKSRHHHFLRWIPLFNSTPSLIYQRKVTLYGVRARDTPEDQVEQAIRKELRAILPELFGGGLIKSWASVAELLSECQSFVKASRYEQVRTFRQWLLPTFEKALRKASDAQRAGLVKAYKLSIELMHYAKCFASILELTLVVLCHSTDADSLMSVVDVLRRFGVIWTCMNENLNIVQSIEAAYQRLKSRGLQSRPLLGLLLELDGGRHLTSNARTNVLADIDEFMTALRPTGTFAVVVPDILPEVINLINPSLRSSPTEIANGLWIKYRMSSDWAIKVWNTSVVSFERIPSTVTDQDRTTISSNYGVLLSFVDQHLPNGLDECIEHWLCGPGVSQLPTLTPDTWKTLEMVLLYLVVQGALKTTTILSGLVYPAWHLAASLETLQHHQLAFLESANNICHHLLLQNEADGSFATQDIFDIQRLRTRRQAVFQEPHFSDLARMVPLLIQLESLEKLPVALRSNMSNLRRQFCQDPGFRQGAYRNLDVIREAFETSPYLAGTTYDNLRKEAMSGLRLIFWDSNPDDLDGDEWPEVSSLLSPWKLAATTIQMQFQIKQVGRALSQETTHEMARNNLDKLTVMLFHHTKTSEEAYYVGEMTRGAEPTVAMKFVNTGLSCIRDLLEEARVEADDFTSTINRVGELLRILIHVTAPFREGSTPLPCLDPPTPEQFFRVLYEKISALATVITSGKANNGHKQNLILLARLLHFILNFREGSSILSNKDLVEKMTSSIFQLALHYGSGDNVDETLYPLLMDTLIFIYDEIPTETKTLAYDPFRFYPDLSPTSIPQSMPPEYRNQLLTLITRSPATPITANLVHTYRDAQGSLVLGGPVANRPWEWVEHLGDPSEQDDLVSNKDNARTKDERDRERFRTKHLVKNGGSLSLETFGARLTGDSIIRNLASREDPRVEDDLKAFEDGLSSESVFARDWRETRAVFQKMSIEETEGPEGTGGGQPGHLGAMTMAGGAFPHHPIQVTKLSGGSGTSRGSPAGSLISRSSGRGSSRRHQSPSQASTSNTYHGPSGSTHGEPIEVDNMSTVGPARKASSSSKRKTAVQEDDDDEVEIVEGPSIPNPNSKRARTEKVAGKTRTSMRKK